MKARVRCTSLVSVGLFVSLVACLDALVPAAEGPRDVFDVASVKPNKTGDGDRDVTVSPGGRFTAQFATLRDLVQLAYPGQDGRLRDESRIISASDWMGADHFDVVATTSDLPNTFAGTDIPAGAVRRDEVAAIDRVRAMLRALLAERFKLAVHTEQRQRPVYALVLANRRGVLGPSLRPVDIDCVALRERAQTVTPSRGQAACGGFRLLGPGRETAHAVSMAMLAGSLSGTDGRSVVDRTGLTGVFDLELEWNSNDVAGPSIFTALQEQLGLKLESATDSVDVLIIDHAEHPTPD
jgi:uncharacterized protein (TIGR03435 family)